MNIYAPLHDRLGIDADINVTYPDGAEDETYLLVEPPYRAANRPMFNISELRLVQGFTPEVIAVLEPHVTALPEETIININTASAAVLRALHQELDEAAVEQLITDRGEDGYAELDTFLEHDALAGPGGEVDHAAAPPARPARGSPFPERRCPWSPAARTGGRIPSRPAAGARR